MNKNAVDPLFLDFLRAFGDEKESRHTLLRILQLDSEERIDSLEHLIESSQSKNAPAHVLATLEKLKNDEIAEIAFEYLKSKDHFNFWEYLKSKIRF